MGKSPRRPSSSPIDQPSLTSETTAISSPVRKLSSSDDPAKSYKARTTLGRVDDKEPVSELKEELEDESCGLLSWRREVGGVRVSDPKDRERLSPGSPGGPSSLLSSPSFSRLANARPASLSRCFADTLSFLLRPSDDTALDAQPATVCRLLILPPPPPSEPVVPTLSRRRRLVCAVPVDVTDPRELGRRVLDGDARPLVLNLYSSSFLSSSGGVVPPVETEDGRADVDVLEVDEIDGVERPNANACGAAFRRGASVCRMADLSAVRKSTHPKAGATYSSNHSSRASRSTSRYCST